MPLCKDEAIVLFKRAYGESDRIIRMFTLKSGKIAAIAKGGNKSLKRFMNTLEPFNHINVEYFDKHGKGMVRLENADIIETYKGIEESIRKVCVAGFFVEFVDRLTKEREHHPELFHILKEALKTVRAVELSYMDILFYKLKMLEILGYLPNFHTCVYCGKTIPDQEKLHFSNEKGGILCKQCSHALPHSSYREGVISQLASIGGGTATHDNHLFERDVRTIMEGFVSYHLDVEFKSYRVLKDVVLRID